MAADSRVNSKPGPEPERVKIDGPWEEAVGKALKKKPPVKKGVPADKSADRKKTN